jgi:hypothetical protein
MPATGSDAEVWFKIEKTNGVVLAPAVGGGMNTTLNAAANPGDLTVSVTLPTNYTSGDIIKIGNDDNEEVLKGGAEVGGVITLDTDNKVQFRHEIGEAAVEVNPTTRWVKLGNVRSLDPSGGRTLQESQALTGVRALANFREGNYDAGLTMVAEAGIENIGMYLLHVLNNDYATVGTTTAGASTTLDANAAIGDLVVSVTSETGFAVGEFAQISTGDGAETIKIGAVSAGQLDLDTTEHPDGLRKAHISSAACVEKVSPFTHTVKRGNLVPGVTFLLYFGDVVSAVLMRGCRISNMDVNFTPDDLPLFNMTLVGKAFQIYGENFFGTPTSPSHTPYSHLEIVPKLNTVVQTTNKMESVTLNINNTITSRLTVGSPFPIPSVGEGRAGGNFSYQFDDRTYSDLIVNGSENQVTWTMTHFLDTNHSLEFDYPKVRFEGRPHPGVASKDPIVETANFLARLDTTPNTDVTVTYKTTEVVLTK